MGAARDAVPSMAADEVTFTNGSLTLRGVPYRRGQGLSAQAGPSGTRGLRPEA
jgi:hypothetical protein